MLAPSTVFGFVAVAHFDAAFVVMAAGMLWTVPSNLVAALYRARGLYGRAVKVQNAAVLAGQFGQLVAIVATGSLLAVTLAYAAAQVRRRDLAFDDRRSAAVSVFAQRRA